MSNETQELTRAVQALLARLGEGQQVQETQSKKVYRAGAEPGGQLIAPNKRRMGFTVVNEGGSIVYVRLADAPASETYSFPVYPGEMYETQPDDPYPYKGAIRYHFGNGRAAGDRITINQRLLIPKRGVR